MLWNFRNNYKSKINCLKDFKIKRKHLWLNWLEWKSCYFIINFKKLNNIIIIIPQIWSISGPLMIDWLSLIANCGRLGKEYND